MERENGEKIRGGEWRGRKKEEKNDILECGRNKRKRRGLLELYKEYEIIGLTETWLEGKEEEIVKRRLEDELDMVKTRKKEGKGRPKGGIILAIKKGLHEEGEKAKKWRGNEFVGREICRKGERIYVGVTYMREYRKENREMMKKMIEEAKNEAIIVGGDYNARTGEKVGCEMTEEKGRKSKDKETNREGEELIE